MVSDQLEQFNYMNKNHEKYHNDLYIILISLFSTILLLIQVSQLLLLTQLVLLLQVAKYCTGE